MKLLNDFQKTIFQEYDPQESSSKSDFTPKGISFNEISEAASLFSFKKETKRQIAETVFGVSEEGPAV